MPKLQFSKREHRNLVQSIRAAASQEEIAGLLDLGETFEHAGDKTRSRWREAARKRTAELKEAACSA